MVMFEIGKHKITAKDKKAICDCWKPEKDCYKKRDVNTCFLKRMERWVAMTDLEQRIDDARRTERAKEIMGLINEQLSMLHTMKKKIRQIENPRMIPD